jgi:hypothetical protein
MGVRFEEETSGVRPVRFELEEATAPPAKPSMSKEASALYGAGQGLTFGYSDEGLAAAKTLWDKLKGSDERGIGDIYKEKVGQERAALEEAQKNPVSYYGGAVVGSLPTMAIPGLGVARGAGLGATLGKMALQGGIAASGESTANPFESPSRAKELAMDTLQGAGVGAATQGVFSGLGGVLKRLSPTALRALAEDRAVKSVTGQNISALRKMAGTTLSSAGDVEAANAGIRKIGRDVLDQGSIGALDTVEDIAPKLSTARKGYGGQIGEVGKQIDAVNPLSVDAKRISEDIANYAYSIPETEAGKKLQDKLLAEAANFEKRGRLSFGEAQDFKNQFQYKPVDADALISNKDATNKIKSIISKEMETTADTMKGAGGDQADLIGRYKDLKSKYGSFKGASDAATDRVQKNLTNRFISPTDYGVGIGTGAVGALSSMGDDGGPDESKLKYIALGALGAMGHKFARTRGSSLAAVTADNLAKVLESSPKFVQEFGQLITDAASRGPAALATTHSLLMKSNPKYRLQIENAENP